MALALPFGLLLVQRERQRSRAVARALRAQGFDVIAAPSVAMAEVLDCSFDAGVIELDLEDGDGLELARTLLAAGRIEEVVFFTGSVAFGRAEAARGLGILIEHREGVEALLPVLMQLVRTRGPQSSGKIPVLDTVPDDAWRWRAG
ncbi:MAG TPA: hypothetical protein PLU22_10015 [Polyangiaceae bacterium]|nr:hypothetical protein [Polyangiaceae bacterium]